MFAVQDIVLFAVVAGVLAAAVLGGSVALGAAEAAFCHCRGCDDGRLCPLEPDAARDPRGAKLRRRRAHHPAPQRRRISRPRQLRVDAGLDATEGMSSPVAEIAYARSPQRLASEWGRWGVEYRVSSPSSTRRDGSCGTSPVTRYGRAVATGT